VLGAYEKRTLVDVVDGDSARLLEDLMLVLRRGEPPSSQLLTFLRRDGSTLAVSGLVDKLAARNGAPLLRVVALHESGPENWLDELVRSEEVLRRFVQTATEAMWCIEFTEPVDLTLGEHEIVRQVFENDCHWLMCNEAMARLYDLPEGLDFNKQPVRSYFPRTPENEAFVRQIIESNFSVDHAQSIDSRHDGSTIYVENAVRCHIEGGRLLSMGGTVRDITDYRQAENRLEQEAQDVRSILGAIPDAILVIDRNRKLLAVNPAFEALLGWRADQFLGRDVQPIIDLESPLPGGRRWYGVDRQRWIAEVRLQAGVSMLCDVQVAPIGEEAPDRFVLALRPALMNGEPAAGRLAAS
jgi:PAS domain S-box-containing protein